MTRRAILTAGIAASGAIFGAIASGQLQDGANDRSNLGRIRLESASRDPLLMAMLDRHASRLAPMLPELEEIIGRRVSIEALTFDQLYANFTIDLLQQTGRYDVVSMCDAWIPYFGRAGYFSEVQMTEQTGGPRTYPVKVLTAATGIDDTPLVAHPWTIDFTCSAFKSGVVFPDWIAYARALSDSPDTRLAIPAQAGGNAADAFRAMALSYGQDVIEPIDHEPGLNRYGSQRAMAMLFQFATRADIGASLERTWSQMPALGIAGDVDHLPLILASDLGGLVANPDWSVQLVPQGRVDRQRTSGRIWMLAVPAGAPALDEARIAVQWLTSTRVQERLWSGANLLPATRPAINSAWPSGSDRMQRLILDALDTMQPIPRLRSFQYVMEITGQMVPTALQNPKETEHVLDDANSRAREVLIEEGELVP